jgi:hypothetical protein
MKIECGVSFLPFNENQQEYEVPYLITLSDKGTLNKAEFSFNKNNNDIINNE